MYSLVPEKPLRLFIPLIFSGGIWNFLLSTPRAFPAGTIGVFFTISSNKDGLVKSIADGAHRKCPWGAK